MKVCTDRKQTDRKSAGRIYMSKNGDLSFCVKLNNQDKWHLFSLKSGLCTQSQEGRDLDPKYWTDATDDYVIRKGDCNE